MTSGQPIADVLRPSIAASAHPSLSVRVRVAGLMSSMAVLVPTDFARFSEILQAILILAPPALQTSYHSI